MLKSLGSPRRIAALLVAGLLILAPLLWITWSLSAASVIAASNREQADALSARLSAFAAGANDTKVNMASVYLPGKSPAIAGAALQRIVANTVAGAGGHVVQAEISRGETAQEQEPGAVSLRAEFETDINGLQKIIFDLETGAPILTVRTLTVAAKDNTATDAANPELSVIVLVRGYWEA
jgi:hypothetical protein